MSGTILEINGLVKRFPIGGGFLRAPRGYVDAVSGVSFALARGETLAIVGESGCGKSTLGRCILRLIEADAGTIVFDGVAIEGLKRGALRPLRRKMQVVFQDPFSSLNPRLRVRSILAEPLENFAIVATAAERERRIGDLLAMVQLPADAADRWPHEFSGGQRQRISIARALASGPDLIVCDEAVSALDVSVKAQIVNLLVDLQRATGVAYVFISHDLAIVEHMAHRIAVMYLGKIVEIGTRQAIFSAPRHPYTRALMAAVPVPDPSRRARRPHLQGDLPSPINPPAGCRFHTRCPHAVARCRSEEPMPRSVGPEHAAACHLNELPESRNPLARTAGGP